MTGWRLHKLHSWKVLVEGFKGRDKNDIRYISTQLYINVFLHKKSTTNEASENIWQPSSENYKLQLKLMRKILNRGDSNPVTTQETTTSIHPCIHSNAETSRDK